jgi:sulfite reductase beta subunit-like hemoprotein
MIKNNIDTIMPGGGKDTPRLNMEKYIQLAADEEKIKSNAEDRILEILLDKYHKQRKPGESYDDWLKRTPREELLKRLK